MTTMRRVIVMMLLAVSCTPPAFAAQDPELGLVRWSRDHDAALASARKSGKPVFALFDEVPGCSTCKGFGADVLSNTLLVQAIETEFVPLFVANNRSGRDAEVLASYREPAWNNPVVRLLDAEGRDVLPRRDGLYSAHEIAVRMIDALRAAKRPVPRYLELAADESKLAHRRTETFATACYWEGEAHFGRLPGVIGAQALDTEAGEAVRVTYDESRLRADALIAAAARGGYTRKLEPGLSGREARGRDHLHALALSPLRTLDLTPLQALRTNAALASRGDAMAWLTPSQRVRAQELLGGTNGRTMAGAACAKPGGH
jgi:hypothetical protein